MTDYDAPHRTETQRLGDDIATAAMNLAHDWPHMLRPGETQAPGWASRSGVTLDDHDRSDADQRRIDRIISLRRFALDTLAGWCRVIIEDRHIENPKVRCRHGIDVRVTLRFPKVGPLAAPVISCREGVPLVSGDMHTLKMTSALDMCTFLSTHADWLCGHETANDARDELTDLAHRCHLTAYPTRRESFSIGRCPLEVPGEQDVLTVCGGDVRSRPAQEGEHDGQAWCACSRCGEVAVASWWEDRMFDDPETQRWLTDAGVVTLIHRMYGEVVAQSTVRGWVKKGVLAASTQRTDDGRRLFDRDAVVYAIDLYKRRQAAQ